MKRRYRIARGILIFLTVAIGALALVLSYTSECASAPGIASDSGRMKAVVYRCYGGPDVLSFEDVDKPVPADNEVLVKVEAASVNPLDWHFMRGSPYIMRLMSGIGAPTDTSMGVDFAGTIEAVGKNVTRFKQGDEVFGGWGGAFAEYLSMPEDRALTLKPENMTFAQSASVPIAGVTALQALRDSGKIKPGQKVLINGASGGVGTFAVQIAKSFGAEVSGVCSTRNVDMVRAIGADHVIDYKQENYTEGTQRYDLIIDNVGNHSLSANRAVLKPNGTLVIVGAPKGNWIAPFKSSITAPIVSWFVDQELMTILAELHAEDLSKLAELMQAGELTPVIDRSFRLHEVAEAIRYSESGRARGKILVRLE